MAYEGVGTAASVLTGNHTFSATPTLTSVTFGAGSPLSTYTAVTTWTPTLDGAVSGTTTYVTQVGQYIQVGGLVFVQGRVQVSAITGTGNVIIGGLPVAIKNTTSGNTAGSVFVSGAWTWPVGSTMLQLSGQPGTSTALIQSSGSAVARSPLQVTNAAMDIFFTLVYFA